MICSFSVPVLVILRGIKMQDIVPIADLVLASGLSCIEITMNTPGAPKLIEKLKEYGGSRLAVGAGTVLSLDDLSMALDAGANFIVTPGLNYKVIECCTKNNIDIYPGALTPTEIQTAWDMGASMVKVFPSSVFGPGYFKELKGPFDKIKLMAVGGVSTENVSEFLNSGASAVAIGGSIFRKDYLEAKNYKAIQDSLQKFVKNAVGKTNGSLKK